MNPYMNPDYYWQSGQYVLPVRTGARGGSDWIGTAMLAGVVGAAVVGYLIYRNLGTSTYAIRGAARAIGGKS